jgi:hypothetical protein
VGNIKKQATTRKLNIFHFFVVVFAPKFLSFNPFHSNICPSGLLQGHILTQFIETKENIINKGDNLCH